MEQSLKWFAAHVVVTPHGSWKMAAVALRGDEVVGLKQFQDEPPNVIWLGGTIELKAAEDGRLMAFHADTGKQLK